MQNLRNLFSIIFLSAFFSVLSFLIGNSFSIDFYYFLGFLVSLSVILNFVLDGKRALYFAIFGAILTILNFSIVAFYILSAHIGLFFIAAYFIFDKNLKTTLKKLDFPGDLRKNLYYGFFGFVALILAGIFVNIIFTYVLPGSNDAHKIVDKLSEFPSYLFLVAIFIAPFSEELFFRGLLAQRFGVLPSAFAFSLSHLAYGSVVEVTGAFVLGIVFALVYKMSKSIMPCIIMHMAYNLAAVVLVFSNIN